MIVDTIVITKSGMWKVGGLVLAHLSGGQEVLAPALIHELAEYRSGPLLHDLLR